MNHTARTEFLLQFRIFEIVLVLRFLLGVEVIEITEELVETMVCWQMFVAVTEMVLAELASGIAVHLEQAGNAWVFLAHPLLGARQTNLGQTGAEDTLSCNKGGPAGSAGLFAVVIGKGQTLVGNAINVRGLVADHTVRVGADVGLTHAVTPDYQDVRFLSFRSGRTA